MFNFGYVKFKLQIEKLIKQRLRIGSSKLNFKFAHQ